MRLISLAFALLVSSCAASPTYAHDGAHDEWLKTLKNENGNPCCDGSDADSVLDPDWDTEGPKGTYRVRLGGRWINVAPEAVVTKPNMLGVAKVWPVDDEGEISIRCFLPGAGA